MSNVPPTTAVAVRQSDPTAVAGFGTVGGFELMQRISKAFSSSDLVPEAFRGKDGNCVIAVELANRIGASPLMVMQNLNVIQGRPAFSSKFIISAINTCGRFSPLRFRVERLGQKTVEVPVYGWEKGADGRNRRRQTGTDKVQIEDVRCTAYALELATKEPLDGPAVTIEMAVLEGWYTKPDSKWKTMPDLMLRYRAASFFGNLYAPEILMGMQSAEEVHDTIDVTPTVVSRPAVVTSDLNSELAAKEPKKRGRPAAQPTVIDAEVTDASPEPEANAEPDQGESEPQPDEGDELWDQ